MFSRASDDKFFNLNIIPRDGSRPTRVRGPEIAKRLLHDLIWYGEPVDHNAWKAFKDDVADYLREAEQHEPDLREVF
jgi:hypothetical protein